MYANPSDASFLTAMKLVCIFAKELIPGELWWHVG